jgi:hypothetical protein
MEFVHELKVPDSFSDKMNGKIIKIDFRACPPLTLTAGRRRATMQVYERALLPNRFNQDSAYAGLRPVRRLRARYVSARADFRENRAGGGL